MTVWSCIIYYANDLQGIFSINLLINAFEISFDRLDILLIFRYVERQRFLERTDERQFEIEKNLRQSNSKRGFFSTD